MLKSNTMTPGESVKNLRLTHNLTQKQFGQKTGIRQEIISALELGTKDLTESRAFQIGKAFNINPDTLLDKVQKNGYETSILKAENELLRQLVESLRETISILRQRK